MLARIKIPPEAMIPLAIAVVALLVLIFFGSKLADWKRRAPESASTFGLAVAGVLTSCAVFFLLSCVTNQSDPNNRLANVTNINFTDAPIAGGMALLAVVFYRYANQRLVALLIGLGMAALMFAKPFVWPVMSLWDAGPGEPRDMGDPEHLMFFGPAIAIAIATVIAVTRKPKIRPAPYSSASA